MDPIRLAQDASVSVGEAMDGSHPVVQEFRRYSGQMERAFEKNRFDTFQQLSMDRFKLLRNPVGEGTRNTLLQLFRDDVSQWIPRIEQAISKKKEGRAQWLRVTGGVLSPRQSGRKVNEVG